MKHLTCRLQFLFFLVLSLLLCAACSTETTPLLSVSITSEGEITELSIPEGSTVREALEAAGFAPQPMDRVTPSLYTMLEDGDNIVLTTIHEEFETETAVLPFSRQVIHSESLPLDETLLLQKGENGLEEITSSILFENGEEIDRAVTNRLTITPATTEVLLIGIQPAYLPVDLDGVIAYIDTGSAWIMQGTSHQKQALVATGDLDSRVFELSPDGKWLLYSGTAPESSGDINTLWIASLENPEAAPVRLNISNVIHYAAWVPHLDSGGYRIAYSTVEPRSSAPGWQANNDLRILSISSAGRLLQTDILLEPNPGGQYGWWGTSFALSPDGSRFAFARADAVGLVNQETATFDPLLQITPFEVGNDFVWTPEITWGEDSSILYVHSHTKETPGTGTAQPGVFQLVALDTETPTAIALLDNTGVFAFPCAAVSNAIPGEQWLALLMPFDPNQLMTTRYQLASVDSDGSNLHILYPPDGWMGIEPYPPLLSPDNGSILFIREDNLWLYEEESGNANQITGSGQISAYDWK